MKPALLDGSAVDALHLLEDVVLKGEELSRSREESLPLGSESDPPGRPVEEAHAEVALQPDYRAAQGLLGDEQASRCPAEVELFGHGHEVA